MNDRHRRFVEFYLVDPNATKAAELAGFSPKTAYSQGARLLKDVEVAAAISAGQQKRAAKLEVKADDVLRELQTFGHADPGEMFDDNGALVPVRKMPEHVRRAIASIEVLEQTDSDGVVIGYLKKVKLWNKGQGLELLGKHLGLFSEKLEIDARLTVDVNYDYARLTTEQLRTLRELLAIAAVARPALRSG